MPYPYVIENTNQSFETYWINGQPFEGIKTYPLPNADYETYWVNGSPASQVYSRDNYDSGKMMNIFE